MPSRFANFGPRGSGSLDIHPLQLSQPVGTSGTAGITPIHIGGQMSGVTPMHLTPPTPSFQDTQQQTPQQPQTDLSEQEVGQLRSIGQRADALPQELRKEYITSQLHDFMHKNLPPDAQEQILDVVYNKGRFMMPRHKSVLSRIGQGLQAIESSGAGFAAGYFHYLDTHQSKGATHTLGLDAIAPWAQYHAIGAGFHDVAPAVQEGYTYTDLIKQRNDPGSLAYKWAKPVGLGMSVVFDPTMYVSFGATSVGREAAVQVLAKSDLHAYTEADRLIQAGHYGGDYNKLHEAAMDVKVKHGLPMTMGDAMDMLHEQGLANKQEIRAMGGYTNSEGQFIEANKRQTAGAWLAPTSAIGARGVRFAGKQIPGTARAGELTGRTLREGVRGPGAAREAFRNAAGGMVPDWAARHVAGDGQRASVLVEMTRFRAQKQALSATIGREVHALQKTKVYSPDEQAAVNIAGTHDVVKVSANARMDLMTHKLEDLPDGALKNLHNNIDQEAKLYIEHAVEAGGNRDDLEHAWMQLSRHAYHDPLAALYDFKLKTSTQVAARDWSDHILRDRRFSIPMYHGAERRGIEKGALERPLVKGPLRPVHLGARAEITTEDGIEHVVPTTAAHDFVAGTIHDVAGTPIPVDSIKQVRNSAGELIWRDKEFVPTGMGTRFLNDVPAGYQAYTHAGRRYAVLDPVADALRELNNPVSREAEFKRFLGVMNKPQDWWKIYATSPNPSFHVMNFLGAMWNNQLAGVYNPIDYITATGTLYKSRKEAAAQAGEKFMFRTPESTPEGRKALNTLTEAENRTGLGRSSFLFADISRGARSLPADLEQNIGQVGKEQSPLSALIHPPEGSSAKQYVRFYTTHRGRQAAAASLLAPALGLGMLGTANPLGLFLLAPEAAKVGQKVTGTIEDIVRLTPFMKYSQDPVIKQVLHKFGPISVDGMKHPRWTKEEQRAMYDIGAAITQHFQFDYTNLTHTERYYAKTFFPFWSYYKNNFVLQARELVKHPRSYAASVRLMNYIGQQGEDMGPFASVLPNYFENLQAFQVPVPGFARDKLGLPRDQPLFLNPKMPFLSLNLVPPMWDIINDPHQTTSQRILELMAPVAGSVGPFAPLPVPGTKLMLEAGTGHNLGLNRPIDFQRASSNDYRQSRVEAPSWAKYMPSPLRSFFGINPNKRTGKLEMTATAGYILDQVSTPFINNLGKSVPTSGSSDTGAAKARADAVSWITGIRLMPVDTLRLARNDAYTMKNILEAKQSELKSQGKELNDKDAQILSDIKYDLEYINDAYNKREGIKP